MDTSEYAVVITTTANVDDAGGIAKNLLEKQLAACVQLLPIHSFYTWEGEIQSDDEILLLIKTRAALYAQVEAALIQSHKYDTPEIIMLPIGAGLPAYLSWISDVT